MARQKSNIPALRFPEFKGEWNNGLMGKLSDVRDGTHDSPVYVEQGYPLITSKNLLKDGTLDLENVSLISDEDYQDINRRSGVNIGDILFGMIGTIGNPVLLKSADFAIKNVALIKEKKDLLNRFLIHYLSGRSIIKQFYQQNTGGTQKFIALGVIRDLEIKFPSDFEQKKIADFLTAVDQKIAQLTEKKLCLEQYKKGVMQRLFTQRLRFHNTNGNPFPDWEEKKLDDVCVCLDNLRKPLNDSERQKMQGTYPYWGANNIMDYIDDYIFDETIILLAEDGGNFNEYKDRPIANLSNGKCWVNNHTHVLKGKDGFLNEFLFYSLVHKDITGYVSGGTRAKLTKGEMLKIPLVIPCLKEQQKIADFLTAIDAKITALGNQLTAAQDFKKSLLQKMFV